MNHSYRSVWNDATGAFVAAPEHARPRRSALSGSRRSARLRRLKRTDQALGRMVRRGMALLAMVLAQQGWAAGLAPDALPTGAVLQAGSATVQSAGRAMTITQSSTRAANRSRVRSSVVQGMLDEVKGRDIVSLDTIERAMLLINDTPGVRVTRADVSPGKRVGTSDFAVATEPTPAYGGFVMLDNHGSRYTGRERLSFNVDANSPTGRGDRLSASGLATAHGDLLHGRLAYSSLLMPNGLRGDVAVSRTRYELGDAYRSLDAQGTAEGIDAQLSYPLRRIRAQTILLSLGASYKSLEDEIRSTGTTNPKRLLSATGGVSIRDESDFFGKAGITQGSVVLSVGNLRLRDASAAALDAAGAQTAGRFGKLVLDASRANLLPAGFMLTASLRHQHALSNKNLDSSERMSVSGSGAVSAYPIGELLGTNATLARLELSRPLAQGSGFSSEWQVFADWGQAAAARPLGPTDERRSLSDVGAGLNLRYEGALLKAVLARRTSGAPVSESYPKYKLLVQAGWVF